MSALLKKIYFKIDIADDLKSMLHISSIEFAEDEDESSLVVSNEVYENNIVAEETSIEEVVKSNALGRVDLQILNNPEARILLKRALGGPFSLQFNKNFHRTIEKSFSSKITDPLSMGYYCDIIEEFSMLNKFHGHGLRNALANFSTLYLKWYYEGKVSAPIELDYGHTETSLIVQIIVPAYDFTKNDLLVSCGKKSYRPAIMMVESIDYSDIFYFEKGNKVVFTFLCSKTPPIFSSFQFRNFSSFSDFNESERIFLAKLKLKKEYEELKLMPMHSESLYSEVERLERPILIGKILRFLKKQNIDDREGLLELFELDRILEKYPIKKELALLSKEDRNVLCRLCGNEKLEEELNDAINAIVKNIDEEDVMNKVSGIVDNLNDELALVKDSPEEVAELWRVKGPAVSEKIKEYFSVKGNDSDENSNWESEIAKILGDHFNLDSDDQIALVKGIKESAMDELSFTGDMSGLNRIDLEIEKLKKIVQFRGDQIIKLHGIVKSMKDELGARKAVSESVGTLDLENHEKLKEQSLILQEELVKHTKDENKKENELLREKEIIQSEILEKDTEINSLEQHLNRLSEENEKLRIEIENNNPLKEDNNHSLDDLGDVDNNEDQDEVMNIEESKVVQDNEDDDLKNPLKSELNDLKVEVLAYKRKIGELEGTQNNEGNFEEERVNFEKQIRLLEGNNKILQSKLDNSKNEFSLKFGDKIKNLEKLNQRLEIAAKKYKNGLAEKKTEIYKAQLENKTLKSKIAQLEKKISNLNKRKIA